MPINGEVFTILVSAIVSVIGSIYMIRRFPSEITRNRAEAEKIKAEAERIKAEAEKMQAEADRANAEVIRHYAEEARANRGKMREMESQIANLLEDISIVPGLRDRIQYLEQENHELQGMIKSLQSTTQKLEKKTGPLD